MRILQPVGWPRPKGYSNGIEVKGRSILDEAGATPEHVFG
jgi:hypothetical protein